MQKLKQQDEFAQYRKIKLLGEGSFGKAYLIERISDKLLCVMKTIDIAKMGEAERRDTLQEAQIIEHLQHPNIVKFIETFKTKKGKLCIVMDYADGGDLGQKMKEQRGRMLSEAQILDWFTQMCLGMKHCHDRKIIHRDLKGANVFLTKKGIVKIGDFGIAKVLSHTIQKAKTMVGTPYYLSPEVVQSKPYNTKTDIWSMGVMLYELCALKPPFDAASIPLLTMKIIRGAYNPLPACFSSEVKSLVKQMLEVRPDRRPDVNKILSMPLIQKRIKGFLNETVMKDEFSHTVLHKQNVFAKKPSPISQLPNVDQSKQQQKDAGVAADAKAAEQRKLLAGAQRPASAAAPVQPPPARDLAAEKRLQNANKFINAQPGHRKDPSQQLNYAAQLRQQKYGISPGMAAAVGGGGYRAHTPNQGRGVGAPDLGGGLGVVGKAAGAPQHQYGYKGAVGNAPQPNYHFKNPPGPAAVGNVAAAAAYQKNRADEVAALQQHRDKLAEAEKQKAAAIKAEQEARSREAEKRAAKERDDAQKKKEAQMQEYKRAQEANGERNKVQMEKDERTKREEARAAYQERVAAQMRVQQRREEADKVRQAQVDEQKARRARQEEISRRIQEQQLLKKGEKEAAAQQEAEAKVQEMQGRADKYKREQELKEEQKKAAEEARRRQAAMELEEVKRNKQQQQLIADRQQAEKARMLQDQEEEERKQTDIQIEKDKQRQKELGVEARAKYKAEELAKLKAKPQQKPDSTIMRICNEASDQILGIEAKILAQQQQKPQQERASPKKQNKEDPKKAQGANDFKISPGKKNVLKSARENSANRQKQPSASSGLGRQAAPKSSKPAANGAKGARRPPAKPRRPLPEWNSEIYDPYGDSQSQVAGSTDKTDYDKQDEPSQSIESQFSSQQQPQAEEENQNLHKVNEQAPADDVEEVKSAEPEEPEIELPNSKFQEGPEDHEAPDQNPEQQYDDDDNNNNDPDNFSSGDNSPVMGGYPAPQDSSKSLFDMNAGNFDDYNAVTEQESEANNEVYQMYEELMNLVQAGINVASSGRSSSELEEEGYEEEGSSSDLDNEDGLKPQGKKIKSKPVKKQRAKWQKKGREQDVEKPIEQSSSASQPALDGSDPLSGYDVSRKYPQEGAASDDNNDSDSDSDEIGRDAGSPVLGGVFQKGHDQKFQKLIKESQNLVSDLSTMQQFQKDKKFEPKMTEVMEETEPESSFKETDKWKRNDNQRGPREGSCYWKGKGGALPSAVAPEKAVAEGDEFSEADTKYTMPPDRDDDFSEDSEDEEAKNAKHQDSLAYSLSLSPNAYGGGENALTFIGGAGIGDQNGQNEDVDLSKLTSVERIKEYLESELGKDTLDKILPIIKAFGDDMLFVDKLPQLKDQLAHLLSAKQVDRYHQSFATLVFYELEVEKAKSLKASLPKDKQEEAKDFDPAGMLQAMNCFKDVATTANFGSGSLSATIGKKRS